MYIKQGIMIFLLAVLVFDEAKAQEESICWEEGVSLKWSDFQGEPDSLITYFGAQALAGAAASIHYRLVQIDTVSINVRVEFMKNRSWTVDTLSASGLAHEQLHFDISELYARKMRKRISELNALGITDINDFKKAAQKLLEERNNRNKLYDKETGHSVVDFMQAEWEEQIAKELESLSKYASTKEDCKCFD